MTTNIIEFKPYVALCLKNPANNKFTAYFKIPGDGTNKINNIVVDYTTPPSVGVTVREVSIIVEDDNANGKLITDGQFDVIMATHETHLRIKTLRETNGTLDTVGMTTLCYNENNHPDDGNNRIYTYLRKPDGSNYELNLAIEAQDTLNPNPNINPGLGAVSSGHRQIEFVHGGGNTAYVNNAIHEVIEESEAQGPPVEHTITIKLTDGTANPPKAKAIVHHDDADEKDGY